MSEVKNCKKCDTVKPRSKFYWKSKSKNKKQPYCIPCHKRFVNKAKTAYKYKMKLEEYEKLLEENVVCQICGKQESRKYLDGTMRLAIDHDHNTGKVRGLLCNNCNLMIGYAQDNPDILMKGAEYLR